MDIIFTDPLDSTATLRVFRNRGGGLTFEASEGRWNDGVSYREAITVAITADDLGRFIEALNSH